jgi:uncharacterized protein YdeI (YjbR/CyaY-like superfamily)
MEVTESFAFESEAALEQWFKVHHATKTELWVRMYKKKSGTPSIDWQGCVVACLCWGWIDGIKKSIDEVSFVQRLTPRRPKSNWSKINCAHAERLIAEGRMQPSGHAHVEAAKKDGRWEQAYGGFKEMVVPVDFLEALKENPAALLFYGTLNQQNLYAIYYRLATAKKPETRARLMTEFVNKLARNERFH